MASRSRARQSTAQPTPCASRTGNVPSIPAYGTAIEAPSYEQLTFTLNPNAQRLLANLKRSHDLQKLDRNIDQARSTLTEAADDITQRLTTKRSKLQNAKEREGKKHEQGGVPDDDLVERLQRKHDAMEEKVNGMTKRMEETMRRLIDGSEYVKLVTKSLDAAAEDARNNASTQASTQNLCSQGARRSTRGAGEEDDLHDEGYEDEDDHGDVGIADFQPTDPAAGTQPGPAPVDIFKKHVDESRTRYQAYSLFDRYSENNWYVNYRRTVHDAAYPDDEIAMPPKDEWFNDDGTVAPVGFTKRRATDEDESDDDLAVSRAIISTKCPLTLKEFQDPLTSTKCDHSFEAEAILDMLRKSSDRLPPQPGQTRGAQAVRCPVSACSQKLSKDDLKRNEWVMRRIRRQQKARLQAQEEEEHDEEESNGRGGTQSAAHRIDSDDDDAADANDAEDDMAPIQLKPEPTATGTIAAVRFQPSSASQPPRASQAINLLDDEDEDEDDELVD